MKTKIGIPEKKLKHISALLEVILANEVLLYTKTRKFHWNVAGANFMEFHKLFEAHYTQLEKMIDEVAERISKLGFNTIGTMKEFLAKGSIKESPGSYPSSVEMVKELVRDHETVIVLLRKDVQSCGGKLNDAGTADFLTGLMETHETIAWTLRKYLN